MAAIFKIQDGRQAEDIQKLKHCFSDLVHINNLKNV
jgi:hypothetical protein